MRMEGDGSDSGDVDIDEADAEMSIMMACLVTAMVVEEIIILIMLALSFITTLPCLWDRY